MKQSTADRLKRAEPGWQTAKPSDVIIRNRSGSVSSRRAYPVAHNGPFVPHNLRRKGFSLIGVGDGNDVYLEPEEDAEAGTDQARDRIKRIKNVGGAAEVLVVQDLEAIPAEITNKLRTLRPKAGTLVTITQEDETLDIGTDGVTGTIVVGAGGLISSLKGLVTDLIEGTTGWSGTIQFDFVDNVNAYDATMFVTVQDGIITGITDNTGIVPSGGTATFSTNNT